MTTTSHSIKIADLDFYSFVRLYRLLKELFPDLYFKESGGMFSDGYISISKVPYDKIEEGGEIVIEIHNPVQVDMECSKLDELDLESKKIKIGFYVTSFDTIFYSVEQMSFDDERFIELLKGLVGKILPARDNPETWNGEILSLAKQAIETPEMMKYLTVEEKK